MNFKNKLLLFIVVLFSIVVHSNAQIGQREGTCVKLWKSSPSGKVDNKGYGTLIFAKNDLYVELNFVLGIAQRAVYRASKFDPSTIADILKLNGNGVEWNKFVQPGRKPSEKDPQKWIRSDEAAMALLSSGKLEVIGPSWYQYLAGEMKKDTPQHVVAVKKVELQKPVDGIVGLWRYDYPSDKFIVLKIINEQKMLWTIYGEKRKNTFNVRWKNSSDENKMYAFTTGELTDNLGSAQLLSMDKLRFGINTDSIENKLFYQKWSISTNMVFKRIKKIPYWRPEAPKDRPVKGDSREDVIRLLGKPKGNMITGGGEIIIYPWGNVWMKNGVVDKVDGEK